MPRQTFATRQFFVNACERATHENIAALPRLFPQIQFAGENEKLHCTRYVYAGDAAKEPIHISVSLLPLNDACTKVTVHGSYSSGCAFSNDPYMTHVMQNVEAGLQAAISGHTAFEPLQPRKKLAQRYRHIKHNTSAFIANALRPRKLTPPTHS